MSDVPSATVVQDGKLGGDVPKNGAPQRPKYKRKLSNYLLDKKLQLRYVLMVTILSGVIAGSLGYLIYQQRHIASASIEQDIAGLTKDDKDDDFQRQVAGLQRQVAAELEATDRVLVYKMAGFGIGLVLILSAYLVIMTHKVAGPLYKVSMYFDRMADGRLGVVTPLRKGDMLQDFYTAFRESHDAMRARLTADHEVMTAAVDKLREASAKGSRADLEAAVAKLEAHNGARKKQLS